MISGVLYAGVDKDTYFKGKDYAFDVYTVEGKEKGPVVLIIGGIHGDETSTVQATEEYTTAEISKGTLIVVPRLNAPAIAKNIRYLGVDMNRVFFAQDTEDSYEYLVVNKIKELIEKADLVLNMHEGKGLYTRTKTGMGQSIVADSSKIFNLKTRALAAIKIMNNNIKQRKYHFKFNDHDTATSGSKHPEQRGSLTYYSVYAAGKPAYGIEVSSDIKDSEYKVKLATEAIDAFLKVEGIEN